MTQTDRIEKSLTVSAPRSRVWRAISDASEFGAWFQVALDGPFTVGRAVRGRITHPGYEHLTMELHVEAMEAERRFAFRWHPHAVDPDVDYAGEPTTLVEFTLSDEAGGTRIDVCESGFDRLPPARRAEAFRMNDQGWTAQLGHVARHVAS